MWPLLVLSTPSTPAKSAMPKSRSKPFRSRKLPTPSFAKPRCYQTALGHCQDQDQSHQDVRATAAKRAAVA